MIEIIKQLRATNSRLDKEYILRTHKDNQMWKDYLKEVFDTSIVYGKSGDKDDLDDLDNLKLLRNIHAGVTVKTINKVYPNLIPMFQIQKAKSDGKVKFPVYAGIKYDGLNTTIIVEDGEPTFYTSSGKPFILKDSIFHNIPDGVYMAEFIGTNGKLGDRQNCGMQTTFRTRTAKGLSNNNSTKWRVFDYVTLVEFQAGKSSTSYDVRHSTVAYNIHVDSLAEEWLVTSQKELDELLNKVVKDGWEGLVLKQPNMKWIASSSRTDAFIKMKKYPTFDLEVVNVKMGEGKYSGQIGSLVLADATGRIVGNVGTGLTDSDRVDKDFIGSVVEVKCERVSPDGILIQPVYLHQREPKCLDTISKS